MRGDIRVLLRKKIPPARIPHPYAATFAMLKINLGDTIEMKFSESVYISSKYASF